MRIFTLVATAALSAALWISVANCGSAGTSSAGTGGGADGGDAAHALVDKFCHDIAGPYCEADWSCCLRAGTHTGNSVDDCKVQFVQTDTPYDTHGPLSFCGRVQDGARSDLEASLRVGTTTLDPARLDACIALLKSMAAGGAACTRQPAYVVSRDCLSALRPQIAAGQSCPWQDKFYAESITQCMDGRCETTKCVPFRKLGEGCTLEEYWSEPAQTICNYAQNEGCLRPLSDGGAPLDAGAGLCAALGNIGDACDPKNNGKYVQCKGWTCDATGTCVIPDPYFDACYVGP